MTSFKWVAYLYGRLPRMNHPTSCSNFSFARDIFVSKEIVLNLQNSASQLAVKSA